MDSLFIVMYEFNLALGRLHFAEVVPFSAYAPLPLRIGDWLFQTFLFLILA